jgi:hypothetical protein
MEGDAGHYCSISNTVSSQTPASTPTSNQSSSSNTNGQSAPEISLANQSSTPTPTPTPTSSQSSASTSTGKSVPETLLADQSSILTTTPACTCSCMPVNLLERIFSCSIVLPVRVIGYLEILNFQCISQSFLLYRDSFSHSNLVHYRWKMPMCMA